MQTTPSKDFREGERKFVLILAAVAAFVAAVPAIFGFLQATNGATYLGYQYNLDDHMVYSAWMRQAMDGHFFMDNRFTTDAQPGLTIHIYFFILGLIAKLLGLGLTATIARVALSFAFVLVLHRLIDRLDISYFGRKLALCLSVFGGGLGFLVWHNYGRTITRPAPDFLRSLLMDRQPTDVWQPEGFVFPSMLTNGLFMVSLCLIVGTMIAVLAAQKSNKSILIGAGAMLVLMNVHSYDVLVVLFALIGLLAMSAVRRQLTWPWVGRAVLIGLGAVPSALWFVHVLQLDPVFQSRAATETYSPNFRAVLFGYLPMIAIGFVALVARPSAKGPEKVRRYAGAAIVAAVFLAMAVFAAGHTTDSYFMGLNAWVAAFVSLLIGLALLADENPTWNLIASWAVLGTIAIYFPGLFQRKLAMGLAIPWGILAAIGLVQVTKNQERNPRNLLAALVLILFSASSFRWLAREFVYLRTETSNTTIHPVYLTADVSKIMAYLNKLPGKKVVAAPPGYATPQTGPDGQAAPDEFLKPLVPDLNPIASGLTGSYTFAGHWSETPDYDSRRNQLAQLFFGNESPSDRLDIIHSIGVNYLIAPVPEAFPQLQPFDFSSLGKVVVDGNQFRLIQVR